MRIFNLLIKVVETLLETIRIPFGFHSRRPPHLFVIGTGRRQGPARHHRLNVIFHIGGFVLSWVPSQRQSGSSIQQEFFIVLLYSSKPRRGATSLLKPPPKGMRTGSKINYFVGQDRRRIESVAVLGRQL